jgi:uncharacterized YigZ family protein
MNQARATLAAPAHLAQEVRKSRFVANAAAVATPAAALAFIESVSDPTATHNCWAFRIGQQYRFNDDGEPSGTAGKPILQAIDGQGLDQVAAVVTRWFGGIKLGAGGLIRAYGGCAAECLRNAPRHELVETRAVEFSVAFTALPILRARLAEFDARDLDEIFDGKGATLRLSIPRERVAALQALLADLTRGRCQVRILD